MGKVSEKYSIGKGALILTKDEIKTLKEARAWWHRLGKILNHSNIRVHTRYPILSLSHTHSLSLYLLRIN